MKVKEQLNRSRKQHQKVQMLIEKYEEYDRLSLSVPGPRYDKVIVDHTRDFSAPFEKWVLKMSDLKPVIEREQKKLQDINAENAILITSLDDVVEIKILRLRYLECKKWEDINEEIELSKDTVFRIHRRAIWKLENNS